MNAFKYLRDVVSGRIKHCNETNNAVVGELWNKLENLESPNSLIIKHFLVAANLVVESLMGFQQSKIKEIIDIDPKKVNIQQFRQLYYILLGYFTFLFYTTNPYSKEEQQEALFQVIDQPELAKKLLQSLHKIGEVDMFAMGNKVWNEVVEIIGFGDKENFFQISLFIQISANRYGTAVDNIKLGINS